MASSFKLYYLIGMMFVLSASVVSYSLVQAVR